MLIRDFFKQSSMKRVKKHKEVCSGKYGSRWCLYGISCLWRCNGGGFVHLDKMLIFNFLDKISINSQRFLSGKKIQMICLAIGISRNRNYVIINKLWNNSQYIEFYLYDLFVTKFFSVSLTEEFNAYSRDKNKVYL